MAAHDTSSALRELAHRENDGLEVTLLWSKADDRVFVRVGDTRSGDGFDLPVCASDALDVFDHPYAHAAARGIHYTADLRRTEPAHA
jgi:hypothetical protein